MARTADLFPEASAPVLPAGVTLKVGFLSPAHQRDFVQIVRQIEAAAPLAQARTPMGGMTSAAMTNCGAVGWWSDPKGYRYQPLCPGTAAPWPAMPQPFLDLVAAAVADTPWPRFVPDACLINFYAAGAKMGLHQDKDERDFKQPIVTVSLGDDADFLIGGTKRSDKTLAVVVRSGDVLIFGGDSRMRYHGIRKIYPGTSPLDGLNGRFSLTFRKAL